MTAGRAVSVPSGPVRGKADGTFLRIWHVSGVTVARPKETGHRCVIQLPSVSTEPRYLATSCACVFAPERAIIDRNCLRSVL